MELADRESFKNARYGNCLQKKTEVMSILYALKLKTLQILSLLFVIVPAQKLFLAHNFEHMKHA